MRVFYVPKYIYFFFVSSFSPFFCRKNSSSFASRCSSNGGIRAKGFVRDLVCGRNRSVFPVFALSLFFFFKNWSKRGNLQTLLLL